MVMTGGWLLPGSIDRTNFRRQQPFIRKMRLVHHRDQIRVVWQADTTYLKDQDVIFFSHINLVNNLEDDLFGYPVLTVEELDVPTGKFQLASCRCLSALERSSISYFIGAC